MTYVTMVYCALFMPRMIMGMALCPYLSVRWALESTSLLVCLVFIFHHSLGVVDGDAVVLRPRL